MEFDVGDEVGVSFGHAEHQLAADDVRFGSYGDFGSSGVGGADEFGDAFFGDIEGVDKDMIVGPEIGGVGADHLGELGNAGIKHGD